MKVYFEKIKKRVYFALHCHRYFVIYRNSQGECHFLRIYALSQKEASERCKDLADVKHILSIIKK